jgi:hypothetical protein
MNGCWRCLESEAFGFGPEEGFELGFVREFEAVGGDEEPLVHVAEGVFGEGVVLVRAQEKPYGRAVALAHLVFAVVAEVGVELPGIGVGERLGLEVDEDVAFQPAVVEDQNRSGVSKP